MRIDEHDIEQIKNATNIVDVISKYISVTKKGKNYVCLCPFHNDSNPSMNISQDKQIYKCFSCGAGGNVFTFVQEFEHVKYPQAVSIVANFINFDLSKYSNVETKVDEKKEELYSLIKNASDFYNFCLENDEGLKGKDYFTSRNLDFSVINRFKLGYAPEDSSKILMFLTKKGYSVEQIVKAGIGMIDSGLFVDRFKGRVIFSLTDLNGRVVGFSGRKIDNQNTPKYVNTNETELFNKSECLYNFYEAKNAARSNKKMYIVEGFMDAIALYKAGIENVVATMGTAFTKEHFKALSSLNVEIVLSLDGDEAGQSATYKIIEGLKNTNQRVKVTKVNQKSKDLDEILNKEGQEAVIKFINNTYSIYEFIFYYMLNKINIENYSDKSKFVKEFSFIMLKEIPDKIERDYFVSLMSEKLNYTKEQIYEHIDKNRVNMIKSNVIDLSKKSINDDRYQKAERQIIKQMLHDAKAIQYYQQMLGYLYDSQNKSIATYICDHYQKNGKIDLDLLITSVEKSEPNIAFELKKIRQDTAMPKEFNKNVFSVIKYQKPLQIEIDELKKEIDNCKSFIDRVSLANKIGLKQTELNKLKKETNFEKEE